MNDRDLISRSALIAKYKEMLSIMSAMEDGVVPVDFRLVAKFIDSAPAVDAVEVVRCSSCKYHNKAPCPMRLSLNWTEDNDFCSYGERREDGTQI